MIVLDREEMRRTVMRLSMEIIEKTRVLTISFWLGSVRAA